MAPNKLELRQQYRELRKQIPAATRYLAAISATDRLMVENIFQMSEHIACYMSALNEFETLPIIEAIWRTNKHCYLPKLSNCDEKALEFVRYRHGEKLHQNQYGIFEPVNESHKILPQQLDLVLLPLIAFDRSGHRLGTGGGFYDRTFAFMYEDKKRQPFMMGIAFSAQETEQIPVDAWDISLDAVLTEQGIIFFSGSSR